MVEVRQDHPDLLDLVVALEDRRAMIQIEVWTDGLSWSAKTSSSVVRTAANDGVEVERRASRSARWR